VRNVLRCSTATTNTIFVNDYLNRRICIYRLVKTTASDGGGEKALD